MRNDGVLKAIGLSALVLLAATAIKTARADESRPNPPYKNWALFNVGASSTLKSVLIDHLQRRSQHHRHDRSPGRRFGTALHLQNDPEVARENRHRTNRHRH